MLIEEYGDVVCPWCYIGKGRLEEALAQRPQLQVERQWRPFQLRPEMPAEGVEWKSFAHDKFGGPTNMQRAFAEVTNVGRTLGLTFDFDRVASAANTVDAHRLILWAGDQGRQSQMASALFKAYFTDGRNLNRLDDLVAVTESVGFEAQPIKTFLAGSEKRAEVIASQQTAERLGIQSVPTFIIDGRYSLVGAQSVELFLRVLDRAALKKVS